MVATACPDTARTDSRPAATGRDEHGRFTPGNAGGPGNPFGSRAAELRAALLARLTNDDLDAIADQLILRAREGKLGAIKLLFQYTLGKPAVVEPSGAAVASAAPPTAAGLPAPLLAEALRRLEGGPDGRDVATTPFRVAGSAPPSTNGKMSADPRGTVTRPAPGGAASQPTRPQAGSNSAPPPPRVG